MQSITRTETRFLFSKETRDNAAGVAALAIATALISLFAAGSFFLFAKCNMHNFTSLGRRVMKRLGKVAGISLLVASLPAMIIFAQYPVKIAPESNDRDRDRDRELKELV